MEEHLLRWMPALADYRQRLATLQGAWDSLALLSHLGDEATTLDATRQAFESLAADLVTHLAAEARKKALAAAQARAQVAADMLVRSLFECTADVGVLAADPELSRFAQRVPLLRQAATGSDAQSQGAAAELTLATQDIQRLFAEYAASHTACHNLILIARTGEVLAQLERGRAPATTRDPLVERTLARHGFVETFGPSELTPNVQRSLIYSHVVTAGHEAVAVLCLCVRIQNACSSIFAGLREESDWTVLSLVDADNEIIASSDPHQIPVGARVPLARSGSGDIIRFAGREYLAISRVAKPFLGYTGPRWFSQVMLPIEHAFEAHHAESPCSAEVLSDLRASSVTFSAGLREIPRQAQCIQRDLNRSVWNGSVRLSRRATSNANFAKALLREISAMGRKTKEVFERSIEELHETAVSSILHESRFMASVAVELLARAFHKRAVDCRRWARHRAFVNALSGKHDTELPVDTVLRQLGSLYTDCYSVVLFDAEGRVIATSRQDQRDLIGEILEEPWAREILDSANTRAFHISRFEPSRLYAGRPTFVFGAPVQSDGKCLGGIAAVFDTAPQVTEMLRAALPRDERGDVSAGSIALFVDGDGRAIGSSDPTARVPRDLLEQVGQLSGTRGAEVVRAEGSYYALACMAERVGGEHPGIGAHAVLLTPLGHVPPRTTRSSPSLPRCGANRHENTGELLEFTTFACAGFWYALPTLCVLEAVDSNMVQSVASLPQPWAGVLLHGEDAVPVIDLASLLGGTLEDEQPQVILLRVQERPHPVGILVDALGDNPEVPHERLLPVLPVASNPAATLVDWAIQPREPTDPLVKVLSLERLAALLWPAVSQDSPVPQPYSLNATG